MHSIADTYRKLPLKGFFSFALRRAAARRQELSGCPAGSPPLVIAYNGQYLAITDGPRTTLVLLSASIADLSEADFRVNACYRAHVFAYIGYHSDFGCQCFAGTSGGGSVCSRQSRRCSSICCATCRPLVPPAGHPRGARRGMYFIMRGAFMLDACRR